MSTSLYLVQVTPRNNHTEQEAFDAFSHACSKDQALEDAVVAQRTLKVIGRDELYVLLNVENHIFLEEALNAIEPLADMTVTPVLDLE